MGVSTHKSPLTLTLFPELSTVVSAIDRTVEAAAENRGAIFTRREVVDFILDLVEYTPSKSLQGARLLEPSFGHGDFLILAVERLMESLHNQGIRPDVDLLKDSVRGVEIHAASFDKTARALRLVLTANGLGEREADELTGAWLIRGDFLLTSFDQSFTHVVGNPPYIRQEMIPGVLMAEYRRRFETIYDRADIYVPFIECSLKLLDQKGVLGFICADRWIKNRYGGPLRRLVSEQFHLRMYVDMVNTPAFHSDVIAYPAITIIAREPAGPTRIAMGPRSEEPNLKKLFPIL